MDNAKKGYLLVFATAVCFGLNGIGIRLFFQKGEPLSTENVAFWGILAASLLVSPVYLATPSIRRRVIRTVRQDGHIVLIVAILSSIGAFLWLIALKEMGAGPVSLLAKSQVLTSTLLGMIFLKERFTAFEAAGLLLALPGILLISTLPEEVPLHAALYILSSTVIYGFQSFLVKRFAPEVMGKEFTFLRAWLMNLIFGAVFGIRGDLSVPPAETILLLGVISMVGLMMGRSLYFEAHKYLPISRISSTLLFEPVFVLMASYVVLDEPLGPNKLAGAGLILTGLWMITRKNLILSAGLPDFFQRVLLKRR